MLQNWERPSLTAKPEIDNNSTDIFVSCAIEACTMFILLQFELESEHCAMLCEKSVVVSGVWFCMTVNFHFHFSSEPLCFAVVDFNTTLPLNWAGIGWYLPRLCSGNY